MNAIEVKNLRREFKVRSGWLAPEKRVIAVDDVTFAAVSSSGVRASDGSSAAWAGWKAVDAMVTSTAST